MLFVREAVSVMKSKGFKVGNLDSTVSLEKTRLKPYIDNIREVVAELLQTETENVSIKAKTGEGLDAVGEDRAIKAEACILLKRDSA